MNDLSHALRDLTALFDGRGLVYAVMGGLAVRAYGIPRPTYDIDFTVAISRERLPELFASVTALGYTVPDEFRSGWVDQVGGLPLIKFRLYLADRGVDIDIFLSESAFQESLLSRRRLEEVDARKVWLVSPEDLVLLKLLANRPRDIADVGDVLFTQGQLDEAYMRTWAKKLEVLPRLEAALANQPL